MKHCPTCRCDTRPASQEFPRGAVYWLLHYGDGMAIADIAEKFDRDKSSVAQAVRSINSGVGYFRPPAGALPWTRAGSQPYLGASAVRIAPDDVLDVDLFVGLSARP